MIRRLFSYVRGMYLLAFIALVLLLGAKVLEAYIPMRLGQLMNGILDGTLPHYVEVGLFIALLLVIVWLLDAFNVIAMNWIGQKALFRIRTQVFSHLQRLHIGFFDRQRVGQLVSRTIGDVDRLQQGFTESLITIAGNVLLLTCVAIAMFLVDWRIALLIFCTFPLVAYITWRFGYYQRICFKAVRGTLGAINAFLQEQLTGERVIRSFALEEERSGIFDTLNQAYRDDNVRTIRTYSTFFASLRWTQSLVLNLTFVGLFFFGKFEAGTFFTFNLYILTIFTPIRDIAERYNVLQEAFAAGERVFALLDERPIVRNLPSVPRLDSIETIAFDNVSFAYSDKEWVLQDISFSIPKGKTVALVGETGSGKSTLMSLLLRFYDVQKGHILINGTDIREYPLDELRRHFSTVLQDPVLFSGTIAQNLSLYSDTLPPAQLTQALQYVGAAKFSLDQTLEPGLSSGEKQLLSLARAIAHQTDALLLDEATANIDALTEHKIQKALKRILTNRTSLVIAHRLSTIHAAHNILLLHQGRILEQGTHAQLLANQGPYEKLYRWQFRQH